MEDAKKMNGMSAERLIGEKLLNYVGMLLIVLGGAFFLKYTIGLMGPLGKLGIGFLSGIGLIALGDALNREERYTPFSLPVIGGGWILIYYTVFAAHYLPASKVIGSQTLELTLLCAAAAGMILHSLKTRSRLLTAFAFGIAYFIFALTHLGVQTLTVCAILALAACFLVAPLQSPELAAINLAGFYLNYLPVFGGVLGAGAQPLPTGDFWYSLGTAAVVHAAYALVTPMWRTEEPEPWVDAALSFSAVLYAAMFYGQIRAFEPAHAAAGLLCLAAVLTGLSAARGRGEDRSALSKVQALLGAAALVLAVFDLDGVLHRAWGFALAASALGTLGLWLDRRSFEKYGLVMMGLGLIYLFACQPLDLDARAPAALALAYLGAAGYALSGLRESADRDNKRITMFWLYGSLASLLLGLWTYLQPPAFMAAMFAFALLLEWAAAQRDYEPLLQQALLLKIAAGLGCFLIDYGSNSPVLGPLTPRAIVCAAAVSAYALRIFSRSAPEGSFAAIGYADWRRAECWLMSAVAAFGIYQEFDPRMRLPIWGAAALVLLALGRLREETLKPAAVDLRVQAYLLALITASEAVCSYLLHPEGQIGALGLKDVLIYWGASLALLAPIAWKAWAKTPAEEAEERLAQHLFAILSLGLPAAFIAKEASGAYITLDWSLLGAAYLVAGLVFEKKALRLSGLALVGLCVLKALFKDLTGLELPCRVLSYTVLGGLLVLSSYLYVNFAGKEGHDEK
ncbi:MAG: DUF2339 domain-containing protein [Elusimicrobia bacterium]|nr:DUF2339 domain-containing protein [Elusimicrobiota bacterium]